MRLPRLVVAHGDGLVLHGVRALLSPEFDVVATARDGIGLVYAVQEARPDAVVLDISLPLLNGIDAAARIREIAPDTKIVFVTGYTDRNYLQQALQAGANGYVLRSTAEEELSLALRTVLIGGSYIARPLLNENESAGPATAHAAATGRPPLSRREREILQLVAEGKSAKEIATVLHLSVKTVEYHKYRLMKRLGVHSSAELATYAATRALLGLEPQRER